ncbi:MAG TPA: hypothetical protein VGK59_03990 [Ohtaekwangia sp.]
MIQLKGTHSSLEYIQQLFSQNKRAFYSRFDLADVNMILNRNASDHGVTPGLSKEVTETFQINHPLFVRVIAVSRTTSNISSRKMLELLAEKGGSSETIILENPVFQQFMSVFQPDQMREVLEEMTHHKRKLFIGSLPQQKAEELMGTVAHYIETPSSEAYTNINTWWPEVVKHIHDVEMVVVAAGDATHLINKRLWEMGVEIQSLDIDFLANTIREAESRMWINEPETEHGIADIFNDDDIFDDLVYLEKDEKLVRA